MTTSSLFFIVQRYFHSTPLPLILILAEAASSGVTGVQTSAGIRLT